MEKYLGSFQVEVDTPMDSTSYIEDISSELFTVRPPTPTKLTHNLFQKLVVDSKTAWTSHSGSGDIFDEIVFHDDELYDSAKDSFRYGRVTSGPTYNLVTGKMPEKVLEMVKIKDERIDDDCDVDCEVKNTEARNNASNEAGKQSFVELYDSQMPRYFEHRSNFPQLRGIWTLLFDQKHYEELSTFELQAAICAALNSKHYLMLCIGVDSFNSITGVEMSAVDRVTFRMALTRAVAGEFQPPLVKLAPKQLTGVSPMKRDVSELTPSVDVLFVPVTGAPKSDSDENDRFLVVVRVKELSERYYQLSSGRIYKEQDGGIVEMSDLNDAFHTLINEHEMSDMQKRRGSMFMLEPEPFITNSSICLEDSDNELVEPSEEIPIVTEKPFYKSLLAHLDIEHIGWLLFGAALSFCLFKNVRNHLVK